MKVSFGQYLASLVRQYPNYVVTQTGIERISSAPREIAEIEALMKNRQRPIP